MIRRLERRLRVLAVAAATACLGATPASHHLVMPTQTLIVALGDSTTAGTPGWQSPLEAPPSGRGNEQSQYAYWLVQAHPEWDVRNCGVDGERSDQILGRFDRDVLAARPRVVIIIAGVNDVYQGRSADEVTANLKRMYERARASGIMVLAGTIIPYDTATPEQNARMHEVNAWIRGAAQQDANVAIVDTRAAAAAPRHPDQLAGSPDGLHPTVEGYHRMADAIRPALERLLTRPRAVDPPHHDPVV